MNIASHGRAGRVSATTIASIGRLLPRVISGVITKAYTEIIRLSSQINTEIRKQSKLW